MLRPDEQKDGQNSQSKIEEPDASPHDLCTNDKSGDHLRVVPTIRHFQHTSNEVVGRPLTYLGKALPVSALPKTHIMASIPSSR